jgi:inosine-uridine nucleoside N-ribohydrolase
MLNDCVFNVLGITTNATMNGGNIDEHHKEAERVIALCNKSDQIKLLKGADKSFEEIRNTLSEPQFDGYQSVDFIIEQALKHTKENKLTVLAVGKLTNIALALEKNPGIADKIRFVWLGANYPASGEYNLVNDIPSMNYLLNTNIEFEMVLVCYGMETGTDAVRITQEKVSAMMPGLGPVIEKPVIGRHGGEFYNFGDYSVDLFKYIDYHDSTQSRALFDMAAVAILKNPAWAEKREIPCPIMVDWNWVEQPDNQRKIILWENFDKDGIIEDLFQTLKKNTDAGAGL